MTMSFWGHFEPSWPKCAILHRFYMVFLKRHVEARLDYACMMLHFCNYSYSIWEGNYCVFLMILSNHTWTKRRRFSLWIAVCQSKCILVSVKLSFSFEYLKFQVIAVIILSFMHDYFKHSFEAVWRPLGWNMQYYQGFTSIIERPCWGHMGILGHSYYQLEIIRFHKIHLEGKY